MCSCQLLALKIQRNFILKNKVIEKLTILRISIFLDKETFAPPCTPPYLTRNLPSDRLWAPLL